jgi:Auxin binding protein
MAWDESKTWLGGDAQGTFYQGLLDDAAQAPARNAKRKKVVHPEEMPWEMARQGLLKHLLNEEMNTRMETVDAYMQIIPAGSHSGKHRHLAEECVYVLEGRGYDLHQDCDVEITDTYHWKPVDEIKRYEWEAGDVITFHPIPFTSISTQTPLSLFV